MDQYAVALGLRNWGEAVLGVWFKALGLRSRPGRRSGLPLVQAPDGSSASREIDSQPKYGAVARRNAAIHLRFRHPATGQKIRGGHDPQLASVALPYPPFCSAPEPRLRCGPVYSFRLTGGTGSAGAADMAIVCWLCCRAPAGGTRRGTWPFWAPEWGRPASEGLHRRWLCTEGL